MTTFPTRPVIDMLKALAELAEFDARKFDEAIDVLERIKEEVEAADDEVIDRIDEIQDYLQYVLAIEDPLQEELQAELTAMIEELQE